MLTEKSHKVLAESNDVHDHGCAQKNPAHCKGNFGFQGLGQKQHGRADHERGRASLAQKGYLQVRVSAEVVQRGTQQNDVGDEQKQQ